MGLAVQLSVHQVSAGPRVGRSSRYNADVPYADPEIRGDLPVAELPADVVSPAPLTYEQFARLSAAWETLPRRVRYVLTARLGLGGVAQKSLAAVGEDLGVSAERVRQLENHGNTELAVTSAGDRIAGLELRPAVAESLRRIARVRDG